MGTGLTRWRPLAAGFAALAAALAAALVAATPAHAKTATGAGDATIVTPLSLVNTSALSFGAVVPSAAAGTVTVSPAGARTTAGGVTPVNGTVSAASFTGLTSGFNIFVVVSNPPASITLTRVGGGGTMTVDTFTVTGGGFRVVNGLFTFTVGATLHVGANQAKGTYNGSFDMTVTYF